MYDRIRDRSNIRSMLAETYADAAVLRAVCGEGGAAARTSEVQRGEGRVGLERGGQLALGPARSGQPLLLDASGAPLAAPSGIMGGTYDLEGEDGRVLIATIPMFSLDSPYETSLPS